MKTKKALTPKMREALKDPKMRDPRIFAPDQYQVYIPSFALEWQPHVSVSNLTPRVIGKGLHLAETPDTASRNAGHRSEDQIERLVDLHDQYEDRA